MCQIYHFILLSELSIIAETANRTLSSKMLVPTVDRFLCYISFIFTDTRLKKVRLGLHAGLFFFWSKKKKRTKHSQKSIGWISIFVLLVCVCWEVPQIFCGPRDVTFHWHDGELMTKYFFWTNCFLNIY